jgi:hypothetical protein
MIPFPRFSLICIAALGIAASAGCGNSGAGPSDPSENRKVATNATGVSLSYPATWLIAPGASAQGVAVTSSADTGVDDPNLEPSLYFGVRWLEGENADGLTIDAWANRFSSKFDAPPISRETTTVSGRPAVKFSMDGIGGPWNRIYTLVGDRVLAISYGPTNRAGAQEFDALLQNLRVDP